MEFDEDIRGESVPSRATLLNLLACFVVSRRYEILEHRYLQPPKRTNLKKLGRNVRLDVIMLGRPTRKKYENRPMKRTEEINQKKVCLPINVAHCVEENTGTTLGIDHNTIH